MGKSTKFLSLVVLLMSFSQMIYAACSQNNNELTGLVGLDSSAGSVYAVTTSSSNECSCTAVRFSQVNTDTKMALSILVAAKMTNKKVRIDILDATDCNSGYRVYLQ